jgi:hypothetical protein
VLVIGGALSPGLIVVFASLPARRSLTKYAHNQSISLSLMFIENQNVVYTILVACMVRPDNITNRHIFAFSSGRRRFSVSHYQPAQTSVPIVVGIWK